MGRTANRQADSQAGRQVGRKAGRQADEIHVGLKFLKLSACLTFWACSYLFNITALLIEY